MKYEDVTLDNIGDILTSCILYIHENAGDEAVKQVLQDLTQLAISLECQCHSDRVQ